ncbi:hypothetical protein NQ314_018331 [Rhamnusium bicolor]|uniref:Uncharacterized protein n=1 Tax=Rhamnusium bicolor TaxID=1586634 RepID=A0AAV8WQH7_9CUCU|nr:hypothetical protein NQ314_018331 [Rhamnusium bicolor]
MKLPLKNMVADLLNMHEILPHTTLVKNIAKTMCNDGSEVRELCADILFFLSGYDSPQLNRVCDINL